MPEIMAETTTDAATVNLSYYNIVVVVAWQSQGSVLCLWLIHQQLMIENPAARDRVYSPWRPG